MAQTDQHLIATVINYCSNDYRFINKCIEEVKTFSDQIIIPVCDHFFDGTPENKNLLKLTYSENPSAQFIEYKFYPDKIYSPYKKYAANSIENRHLWHSTSRYISYFFLKETIQYVLFIDADEIYEGNRFKRWLDKQEYKNFDALRIGSYIYFSFEDKIFRGDLPQIFGLMAKKTALEPNLLLAEGERFATFKYINGLKKHMVLDRQYLPMSHHFSWVRTKQEKLKKVKSWGHFADKPWEDLVCSEKEIFLKKNKDPYYEMNLVPAQKLFFNPLDTTPCLQEKLKKTSNDKTFPNVYKTNREEMFEKEIKLRHGF